MNKINRSNSNDFKEYFYFISQLLLMLLLSMALIKGVYIRWSQLMQSLSEEDWNRKGKHPEIGEVTVQSLFDFYLNQTICGTTYSTHCCRFIACSS